MKPKKVYVDVDGVLLDFVSRCEEIIGMSIQEINARNSDPIREMLVREIPNGFYTNLEPMKDYRQMIELINELKKNHEVSILTVCYGEDFDRIHSDKKTNLENVGFGGIPVIGVTRSSEKAEYACPDSILIDDRSRSCIPFSDAGGTSIKHKSAAQTMTQLKNLGVISNEFTFSS